MAIVWIYGSNEVLVSEALSKFLDGHGGPVVWLDNPKSQKELESKLSNFGLMEKRVVVKGVSYVKKWKDLLEFLGSREFDVAVVSPKDMWELKDDFYKKLKKAADSVVVCSGVNPYGTEPAKYVMDRAKHNGVELDPKLVWAVYACTGVDASRIENEVKKLSLLGNRIPYCAEALSILHRSRVGDINFDALLKGDFGIFVQSCDGIESLDLFWRLINKFFKYIQYKTILETQGTLFGKVSRFREASVTNLCKGRTMQSFDAGVSALVKVLPLVRDYKLEAPIYGALYDWART